MANGWFEYYMFIYEIIYIFLIFQAFDAFLLQASWIKNISNFSNSYKNIDTAFKSTTPFIDSLPKLMNHFLRALVRRLALNFKTVFQKKNSLTLFLGFKPNINQDIITGL